MAPAAGLFAPAVRLGDEVEAGALAGTVYDAEDLAAPARHVHFARPGRVVARRVPALTKRGDFLFTTAIAAEGL